MPRRILIHPNKQLKVRSRPVEDFSSALSDLANSMLESMYESVGCGLAAVQVGIHQNLFVLDSSYDDNTLGNKDPLIFVNPKIVEIGAERILANEGCLSIPDVFARVDRAASVELEFFNEKGKKQKKRFTGLQAIIIQHELDHLDGTLFIEKLSATKRHMLLRRYNKIRKLDKKR